MPNETPTEKLARERQQEEAAAKVATAPPPPLRSALKQGGVTVGLKHPGKILVSHRGVDLELNGASLPHPLIDPNLPRHDVVGGYGLTHGVDPEFIRGWAEEYRGFPHVQNGLLFWEPTPEKARKRALEQAGVVSGFESLPEDDGKGEKGVTRDPDGPVPGA